MISCLSPQTQVFVADAVPKESAALPRKSIFQSAVIFAEKQTQTVDTKQCILFCSSILAMDAKQWLWTLNNVFCFVPVHWLWTPSNVFCFVPAYWLWTPNNVFCFVPAYWLWTPNSVFFLVPVYWLWTPNNVFCFVPVYWLCTEVRPPQDWPRSSQSITGSKDFFTVVTHAT